MENVFEFNQQPMFMKTIKADDIANVCFEGWNDDGYYYYLITRTIAGYVYFIEYGPVIPDVDVIPDSYSLSVNKMEYKEPKIIGKINFWLNDRSKKLTEAQSIEIDDALNQIKDIQHFFNTLGD